MYNILLSQAYEYLTIRDYRIHNGNRTYGKMFGVDAEKDDKETPHDHLCCSESSCYVAISMYVHT